MAGHDGQIHPSRGIQCPDLSQGSSDAAADSSTAQSPSALRSSLLTPLLHALHRASASSGASSCWRTSSHRRHHQQQQCLQLQLVLQAAAAAGRTPLRQILLPWWPSPWPEDLQLPAAAGLRVLAPAASAVVACAAAAAGHLLPADGLLQHALPAAGVPGGPGVHHTGQVPGVQHITHSSDNATQQQTNEESSPHVHHILQQYLKQGHLHLNAGQLWQVSDTACCGDGDT